MASAKFVNMLDSIIASVVNIPESSLPPLIQNIPKQPLNQDVVRMNFVKGVPK